MALRWARSTVAHSIHVWVQSSKKPYANRTLGTRPLLLLHYLLSIKSWAGSSINHGGTNLMGYKMWDTAWKNGKYGGFRRAQYMVLTAQAAQKVASTTSRLFLFYFLDLQRLFVCFGGRTYSWRQELVRLSSTPPSLQLPQLPPP